MLEKQDVSSQVPVSKAVTETEISIDVVEGHIIMSMTAQNLTITKDISREEADRIINRLYLCKYISQHPNIDSPEYEDLQ